MEHKDTNDLHFLLVETIIDFIKERQLKEVEEIVFRVDSLQESVKHGSWHPSTDSSLVLYGYKVNGNKTLPSREIIDESY